MEEANEDNPHPLLLSPVIHSVMEFLSIRDLISSRLVCENWNTAGTSVLRKNKTLKFRMQLEHLEDYTETMKGSKNFPYTHYELEFFHMNEPIIQKFFQICGNSITTLQLNNCRCTSACLLEILSALKLNLRCFSLNCDAITEQSDELLPIITDSPPGDNPDASPLRLPPPHLPPGSLNLKSLTLFGEFCKNQQLVLDLLKSSERLESIEFRCYDNLSEVSDFETMCYEAFLQPTTRMDKLTSFKMKSRLNNEQIMGLRAKNLELLTCLHINLDWSVQPLPLYNLLANLAKTLKKLDLSFALEVVDHEGETAEKDEDNDKENEAAKSSDEDNHSDPAATDKLQRQYTLPPMDNLLRLTISNFKGSLAFINDCEKLMYLALISCDVTQGTLAQVRKHPLKSLVSTTPLDSNLCTHLAQVFPDLIELNGDVNDEALRRVFDVMGNLEELTITGEGVTDDGLTGIDGVNELDATNAAIMEVDPSLRFLFNFGVNQFRKHPFVGNLTKLRKLQIQNASCISDASVIHGLILCNHLSEISLLNSKVTDCSLRAIADHLPQLKKLETLSYLPSVTPQGKEYIRTKLTGCDFILGQQDLICMYRPRQIRTC